MYYAVGDMNPVTSLTDVDVGGAHFVKREAGFVKRTRYEIRFTRDEIVTGFVKGSKSLGEDVTGWRRK